MKKFSVKVCINLHKGGHFNYSKKMCLNILKEIGMIDCRTMDNRINPNQKLMAKQSESFSNPKYLENLLKNLLLLDLPYLL